MTPRELVRRTLGHDSPSRVPRQAWITPWAEQHFPEAVARLHVEFPDDIVTAPALCLDPPPSVGHPH
jgi:uroporphyrinogen decarboxylase